MKVVSSIIISILRSIRSLSNLSKTLVTDLGFEPNTSVLRDCELNHCIVLSHNIFFWKIIIYLPNYPTSPCCYFCFYFMMYISIIKALRSQMFNFA